MAKVSVSLTIDPGKVRAVVGPISLKAATKAANKTKTRVQQNITNTQRIDTGRMRSTIYVRRRPGGDSLHARVVVGSDLPYTHFQEAGTRAHGPVTAPFLVFTPKGGSHVVRARWVRGVTAARFFANALDDVKAADFQ